MQKTRRERNSPPRLGGVAAPVRKCCEATKAQTGWLSKFKQNSLLELVDHPVRSSGCFAPFLDLAATPPNLGGELRSPFNFARLRALVFFFLLSLAFPLAAQQRGAPPPAPQAAAPYRAPRTGDNRPSLNGIWQAVNE